MVQKCNYMMTNWNEFILRKKNPILNHLNILSLVIGLIQITEYTALYSLTLSITIYDLIFDIYDKTFLALIYIYIYYHIYKKN